MANGDQTLLHSQIQSSLKSLLKFSFVSWRVQIYFLFLHIEDILAVQYL